MEETNDPEKFRVSGRGELEDMIPDGKGRVSLDYMIPARGLIGFQTDFRTMTRGSGIMVKTFSHYGPVRKMSRARRPNGVLVSMAQGKALAYSLANLEDRGTLFVGPGDEVYEGQIVGLNSRESDLTVNPLKGKKLTNMRAAGRDDNVDLTPATRMTLEQCLEFIEEDELVEVTPESLRLRKRHLKENDRKRAAKAAASV